MRTSFLTVFFMLFIPGLSHAQATIFFVQPSYDFASIGEEQSIGHSFEFINKGDMDLIIDKVLAS